MRASGSELEVNLVDFAARLLGVQETAPRARLITQAVLDQFPDTTTTVYLLDRDEDGDFWSVAASVGEGVEPDATVSGDAGTLGTLLQEQVTVVFEGHTLVRENYAHLNVRRTVKSLACVPLLHGEVLVGALEILSFDAPLNLKHLDSLRPMTELSSAALVSSRSYEQERSGSLNSITRLTQFYDIEKVFSSTLEMEELLPIIGSKIREMLNCEAVNVWLLEPDESVRLMHQAGLDETVQEQCQQRPGEGIAGDVSDSGEALLIDRTDDRVVRRNRRLAEGGIVSLIAAPLLDQGALVGVLEAVNKLDGTACDEDDLFTLSRLAESASIALHNASLLAAERKVEVLEALVNVSHEITSTLDLDRVLQAVVNGPASVIPYERAAIALEEGRRMKLRAISGTLEINPDDPKIADLNRMLEWASLLQEPILVNQHGDEISTDREATRTKFQSYFSESGMRAMHVIPLGDEEGRVGVLSFESSNPDFLSVAHLEMIKVLANQATVALRNASLYKEVPFIGVLQPLMEKKRKFLALEKHSRTLLVASACAAVLFLALFPLPLRVEGPAAVAPAREALVGADIEGIVKQVNVKEGDRVQKGTIIGTMEDWDYRSALAAAEAKRDIANELMNRALATNDGSEAGIQKAQADYWTAEVARAKERLDRTLVRSPIDGVVATPHVENMVGKKLKFGESFAQIVDNSEALVDLTIDQTDISLVAAGQRVRVKLDGFPERTFQGQVVVVSPLGRLEAERRNFYARVAVQNPDGILRAGMQGLGKVSTGWHPAGKVFFRQPVIWIWSKLWSWFGW